MGRANSGCFTAFMKHRAVERGVVRRKEVDILKERPERSPNLPESRLVRDVFPGNMMQIREVECPPRRPNKAGFFMNDPRAPDFDYADRAGAVPTMVGCLKINRYECRFLQTLNPCLIQCANLYRNIAFIQSPPADGGLSP
jgi:hypothetical protein